MSRVIVKDTTFNGCRADGPHRHGSEDDRTNEKVRDRYNISQSLGTGMFDYEKKNVGLTESTEDDYDEEDELVEENMKRREFARETFTNRLNEYTETGRRMLLTEALSRVYVQSLPLDVSNEHVTSLRSTFESFMVDGDVYKRLMEQRAKRFRTPFFVKRVQRIIESIVLEKTAEKSKQAKDEGPENVDLDFSLDGDEKETFHERLDEIGVDEVSDSIKDKVVHVVKEERVRQKKEMDELNQVQTATEEDEVEIESEEEEIMESDEDEETVEESIHYSRSALVNMFETTVDDSIDDEKDTTLMDAMFRSTLRTVKERRLLARRRRSIKNVTGSQSDSEELPELTDETDMNLVFAETVANYTLLETAHTLRLMEFSDSDVKNLVFTV